MKMRCFFKNNRGMSSHIETIMAFILFIGFVFFVIIFIRPFDSNFLTSSIVSGMHHHFLGLVKAEVVSSFVYVQDNTQGCLIINSIPDEFIGENFNSSLVKKSGGGRVDSLIAGNSFYINLTDENAYYFFISEFFEEKDFNSGGCIDADYTISRISKEEIIPFSKLKNLQERYENDYENLKKDLTIPSVFDFAIRSDYISFEKEVSSTSEVLAQDYIEKVIFDDGTIKFVRFTFSVWR